jgi:hypothetical protein
MLCSQQAHHHVSSSFKAPNQMPLTPAPTPGAANDTNSFTVDLPERPSPDGGEDHIPTLDDEAEAWSDWDVTDNAVSYPACRHVHKVSASDSCHVCPCGTTRLPLDRFSGDYVLGVITNIS